MLGAHLVSTFSGSSYIDFVKNRIWDPLDMSTTTYSPAEAARSGKLAQAWTPEGRRIPFWFPESCAPSSLAIMMQLSWNMSQDERYKTVGQLWVFGGA